MRVIPSWLARAEGAIVPVIGAIVTDVAGAFRHFVRWGASHTGLPAIVVAALALVLAWRVAKRTWTVAFELAVAVGILLAATRFGWIRW